MNCVSTFAIIICALTVACDRTPAPKKLKWDLSVDNSISRVGWGETSGGNIWHIDGPGVIHLKVRGGSEHDVPFSLAQVWRDGNRIRTIRILLPSGSVEETQAAALKLAADWNIPDTSPIDNFLQTRGRQIEQGGRPFIYTALIEGPQPRSIEIRQSFSPEKPWYSLLAMGFQPDFDNAITTTRPNE